MSFTTDSTQSEPAWLGLLKSQIESLRFGTVQVVVHEGRVVQIEKTEKVRLDKPDNWAPVPTTTRTR